MASWEDEDFDSTPAAVALTQVAADKWEGEDEDDVVEDWDADEKPPKEETPPPQTVTQKKKRNLKEIIAEKEQKKKEELEKKKAEEVKEDDDDDFDSIPKTELERQKVAEESELSLLQETFGNTANEVLTENSIDQFNPSSREDFDKFLNLLKTKLLKYERSPHYTGLLENLFRELTVETDTDFLRKMGSMFSALANEKLKIQKSTKGKKKSGKGKIAVVRANDFDDFDENAGYDEFDDF